MIDIRHSASEEPPARSEEKAMKPSIITRILGWVVAASTIISSILVSYYFFNRQFFYESYTNIPFFGRHLTKLVLAALVISGAGSLFMLVATKKLRWIACLLGFVFSLVVLVLVAMTTNPVG